MIRIYSYPITPQMAYNSTSRFFNARWTFGYFTLEVHPDLYAKNNQFRFFARLWQKGRNKPIFRLRIPRIIVWKLATMMQVVRPCSINTEMNEIFEKGKTKDWYLFEELFKRKLEEKRKQFKRATLNRALLLEQAEAIK